jgi:L-aspartate oxidase
MSACAGVVRDGAGLARLAAWIAAAETVHGHALPLVAARLIVQGALGRRESRGAHYRTDFPKPALRACHTRLTAADMPDRRRRAA